MTIHFNYNTKMWHTNGKSFRNVHDAMTEEAKGLKKVKRGKRKSVKLFHERDGNTYRSTWEVVVADALYEHGIEYLYEPTRFKFHKERESYLPDFYLPEQDIWIEIKGWMDERSKKRLKLFKKYHSQVTLGLLMKEEIDILKKDSSAINWMVKQIQEGKKERRHE